MILLHQVQANIIQRSVTLGNDRFEHPGSHAQLISADGGGYALERMRQPAGQGQVFGLQGAANFLNILTIVFAESNQQTQVKFLVVRQAHQGGFHIE